MTTDQALSENTLIVGLEVDSDSRVDRDYFLAQFQANPRGNSDWHLDVEKSLLRQLADEVLANTDFTEDSEDGNAIEGWTETQSTQAYRSGNPVSGEWIVPWHESYVQNHYAKHPLWFKITGSYLSSAHSGKEWLNERFRLRAQSDSLQGGFELRHKRYGVLRLKSQSIIHRLAR